jgi:hypothetical protein
VECSIAQAFWSKLKELEGIKLPKLRSKTWPEDILEDKLCREEDRIVILCGMWSLWNIRNDYYHGKQPIVHSLAIDWAMDACYHLLIAQKTPRRVSATRVEQWQPPPTNVVKINCDGGFLAAEMRGSTGAVLRDANGALLGASANWLSTASSALVAEAEACREGVRLVIQSPELRSGDRFTSTCVVVADASTTEV